MTYLETHESVKMKVPAGWTEKFHISGQSGELLCKDAVDKDGFVWCPIDGEWRLYVPAFGVGINDGKACVVNIFVSGDCFVPHDEKTGVITLGKRNIKPERWYH